MVLAEGKLIPVSASSPVIAGADTDPATPLIAGGVPDSSQLIIKE